MTKVIVKYSNSILFIEILKKFIWLYVITSYLKSGYCSIESCFLRLISWKQLSDVKFVAKLKFLLCLDTRLKWKYETFYFLEFEIELNMEPTTYFVYIHTFLLMYYEWPLKYETSYNDKI